MSLFLPAAAIVVLILVLIAWMAWRAMKGRHLSPASARRHMDAWKNVLAIQDDHRRVLEAEKVIDSALSELGFTGTFADKLRKAGSRFSYKEQLWAAHKLRNRIAHEMGMALSEREVRSAMATFERTLNDLS